MTFLFLCDILSLRGDVDEEKYALNKNTKKLHIVGKCRFTSKEKKDDNMIYFLTEDDAIAYGKGIWQIVNCVLVIEILRGD